MLDPDTCIRLRSRRRPEVLQRFATLEPADAVVSAATCGELRVGVEKSPARTETAAILARFPLAIRVLPVTPDVADADAGIRAVLERRGELIGANDLWIAAHARALGLTLVAGNEREFRRVPDLAVENRAVAA